MLDRDYASVYTKPDITENRSTLLNVTTRHSRERQAVALGQCLLPPHPDRRVQRRHQRRLARSGDLPAERRGAGRAGRGRLHRCPGERRHGGQHAVPVVALHRQRAAPGRAGGKVQRADQPHATPRSTTAARSASSRAATRSPAAAISSRRAAATIGAASASCSPPSWAISIPIAASPASAPSATAPPAARSTASRSTPAWIWMA